MLRYLLLHFYGGIYLDLDITCLKPLDNLLHVPFLTAAVSSKAVGVSNAFILSRPQHPFLDDLIGDRAVSYAYEQWPSPWFEAMVTTGYLFLSNGWMDYVRNNPHPKSEDAVFVLADENGQYDKYALGGTMHTPLFKHKGAITWQLWDAGICTFMEQHLTFVIAFLASFTLIVLLSMIIGWYLLVRRGRQATEPHAMAYRKYLIQKVYEFMTERDVTAEGQDEPSDDYFPSNHHDWREVLDQEELPDIPAACHFREYNRPPSSMDRPEAYDQRTATMLPPLNPPHRGRSISI